MISNEQNEILVERLINRIDKLNEKILIIIGKRIKEIGNVGPTKIAQIQQMLYYGKDLDTIMNDLAKITNLNINDIYKIFEQEAIYNQEFAEQFYNAKGIEFIPYNENKALQEQIKSIARITADKYINIANTRSIGYTVKDLQGKLIFQDISTTYKKIIDKAILNIAEGKTTYQQEMKDMLKQIGKSGLTTIDYKSGNTRRLDSAIRMNLLDSIKVMNNDLQQQFGQEFGADGVEISVHINPAPDHQEVQGHQFSNEEFQKFQNNQDSKDYKGKIFTAEYEGRDRRSISEYNCYHYIFSIVLGVSEQQYSNEELQRIIDDNNKGFELDGKHYTNYEGTQLQRKLETEIRNQKNIQILAKASDNEELIFQSQLKITQLSNKYKELNKISGLPNKNERMITNEYRRNSTKKFENKIKLWYNTGNISKDYSLYKQVVDRQRKIKNGVHIVPANYKEVKK